MTVRAFTPPIVLGLAGPAGSGKSTVAALLAEHHGFTRLRLAGPLKAMLRAIGLDDEAIEGAGKEQPHPLLCGQTPRHAMMTLGTEWGRDRIGPDFWTSLARTQAARLLEANPAARIVFEDVRFENEADTITRLGGLVVKIAGRAGLAAASGHASELQAVPFHMRLMNDGPIEILQERVHGLMDRLTIRDG